MSIVLSSIGRPLSIGKLPRRDKNRTSADFTRCVPFVVRPLLLHHGHNLPLRRDAGYFISSWLG